MARKKSTDYVNNATMFESLMQYKQKCAEATEKGVDIPLVPDYLCECFIEIARRFSSKPNFSAYSYREDMVWDGVEACLKGIKGFNPARSQNPFAFFTTAIYYAFIQRIELEQKEHAVKIKNMIHTMSGDERFLQATEDMVDDNLYDFIAAYDQKRANRKAKLKEAKKRSASIIEGIEDDTEK